MSTLEPWNAHLRTMQPEVRPAAVTWYRVYLVGMVVLMLVMTLIYVVALNVGIEELDPNMTPSEAELTTLSVWLSLFLLPIPLLLHVAGLVLPRTRWAWVVHIVIMASSLLTAVGCCFVLLASAPMFGFWMTTPVRRWYGFMPR